MPRVTRAAAEAIEKKSKAGATDGRASAKDMLALRIAHMREEADRLEKLHGEMPDDLSPEADLAFWLLLTR